MATSLWNDWSFWTQRESLLRAAAWRSGRADPHESIGVIWLRLTARFPQGVEDIDSSSQLDRVIYRVARRYFQKEASRLNCVAGKSVVPMESMDQLSACGGSHEEAIVKSDAIRSVLAMLKPSERELIEKRIGLRGREYSTAEIAGGRNVTRQAVRKKLRRIEVRIKRYLKQNGWEEIDHDSC